MKKHNFSCVNLSDDIFQHRNNDLKLAVNLLRHLSIIQQKPNLSSTYQTEQVLSIDLLCCQQSEWPGRRSLDNQCQLAQNTVARLTTGWLQSPKTIEVTLTRARTKLSVINHGLLPARKSMKDNKYKLDGSFLRINTHTNSAVVWL